MRLGPEERVGDLLCDCRIFGAPKKLPYRVLD
jgi:hypothetical protein